MSHTVTEDKTLENTTAKEPYYNPDEALEAYYNNVCLFPKNSNGLTKVALLLYTNPGYKIEWYILLPQSVINNTTTITDIFTTLGQLCLYYKSKAYLRGPITKQEIHMIIR
jgi:hypothetical protein